MMEWTLQCLLWITLASTSAYNYQGEIQDRSGDAVVFPGPTTANSYVPEIPDDCKDIGICESIPNYPQAIVDTILSELGKNKQLLYHLDQLDEPQISQRIGPGYTDSIDLELCNSREAIITPQAAKDVKGDWYVILNQKDKPIQGYRVEICKYEGRSCANNIATFNTGYSAYCKQKYVQRTMTALDVNKQAIIYDLPFRVPSCCSCVARQSGRE
ncbi:protein spaetzle isoform X2 [Hyposmocoma kahamanoa]|uniref:protein spaetzle isoform X2 n=1 Tax=Hyposmocoma kahamanoa TaxID=1477025 RepID=UPI000E6D8A02|nr:protein spaetzle isoform X2 [Hyposmocoma kahamanoa]